MNIERTRKYNRLLRVREFILKLMEALGVIPQKLTDKFNELDAVITEIRSQSSIVKESERILHLRVLDKAASREKLRDEFLIPIASAAKANKIAMPNLPSLFLLPHQNGRESDFIDKVNQVSKHVALHEEHLVVAGLPDDIVQQFRDAKDRYIAATGARKEALNEQLKAGRKLDELLNQGATKVFSLNAVLRTIFPSHSGEIKAWTHVQRVQSPPERSAEETPPPEGDTSKQSNPDSGGSQKAA